jgi:tellurite resistance protein TehA-like permease
MLMAVLITLRYLRAGIPFNLGWWGFTFPLGVYSLATLKLASTLHLVVLQRIWLCAGEFVAADVAGRRQTHCAGRLAR